MHILGLASGTAGGNSEILLKAALQAAREYDPTITVSWVHIPSVVVPLLPKPLRGAQDVSNGLNPAMSASQSGEAELDDRAALWDHLMEADAYIFATPIYSRSPAGGLKGVLDWVLGPFADATLATKLLKLPKESQRSGITPPDTRVLKPRVAGLMAVGGSWGPDQVTMAMPALYQFVNPLHVRVVDQVVFQRAATPGAVLLSADHDNSYSSPAKRAEQLGRSVASQLGKTFDEAQYLGPRSISACPYCHMDKVDLFYGDKNEIGCIGCGAKGKLTLRSDGVIRPEWNFPCEYSSVSWQGKSLHVEHIWEQGSKEKAQMAMFDDFESMLERSRSVHVPLASLPSHVRIAMK